ncbi:CHASE3 domain-containing protein [Actinoplanes sp. NEAU-A11]|uniref:histidine kinase n=2 Tax=Actinoplanes aureus TaxID=2792083 RepID=A0A931FZ12_9ACTN|nr:CHASE3 domain-containing protein [Actinoplanes aureus]
MAVLIVGGTALGARALAHTTAVSNRLSDHISPARTTVVQLDVALLDQATGVRGYLLSGQDALLEPYPRGVAAERAAAGRLRELLAGEPALLAELTEVETLAARWRADGADPLVENRRRTGTTPEASADTAFETVRRQVAALDERLIAEREAGRAALDRSRRVRNTVFVGLAVLLLAAIASIAVLLRVVVLRPLGQLGDAVRRVAAGDFEHRFSPRGPADLVDLGRDVEAMRGRLVDALVESRQAHEELRRSNADLEQFAYVASHDLQEPLRKVASFCQMLQRRYADALDERAQQYIGFAVDGATRMQRLINDLLAFSRIGRVYDGNRPVDLNDVLDQVEQILAARVDETGARIVRPPLPTVPGDATLLTMLWQNLLSNALKFHHPDRPPQVEITATDTGGIWTFTVRDNGIGIDPQFADKIFVIFQRLHSREEYSGTGIGLAICKRVVEYHGGTIELDRTYTGGAGLTFTLPALTPAEPPASLAESAPAA